MEISEILRLKEGAEVNISKLIKTELLNFYDETSFIPKVYVSFDPIYVIGKKEPADYTIKTSLVIEI